MGLFILDPNELGQETIESSVDKAIANLKLWKENQGNIYLIDVFALSALETAMRLVRKNNGESTEADLQREKEIKDMID